MATELAVAYVSLAVSSKGMRRDVARELGGIEQDAAKSGKRSGGLMSRAMGGAVAGVGKLATGALVGGLAAAGATAATAFTKGFGRLKAIEEAQAKLRGLGHDAATIDKVMENANTAVKGTAFGLGEAATAAASALAAGIEPGQELENHLKLIGDAATIAGVDFNEMGAIFGKVAAGGIIQGEEIAQLSDQGIPILQLLGDELGVTALEAKKMASEGKVSFETFSAAMQKGMGGAALESGKTVQGAFNNLLASLGRIGANILKPLYDLLPGFLTWVTGALKPVEGVATAAASGIMAAFGGVGAWLSTKIGPALAGVFGGMSAGVSVTDRLRAAFAALVASPFGQWVRQAVTELVSRLAPAFQTVAGLVTTRLLPAIMDIARVVGPALGAAVAAFARFAGAVINSPIFQFLAGTALAVVMGFVGGVVNAFTGIVKIITGALDIIAGILTGAWGRVWEGLKTVVSGAVQAVWGLINIWLVGRVVGAVGGVIRGIGGLFGGLGGLIRGGVQAAIAVVRGFVTNLTATVAGIWAALGPIVNAIGAGFGIMAALVAAAWTGIVNAARSAWAAISPVLSTIATTVGGALTTAWRGLVAAATAAWNGVRSVVAGAWAVLSPVFTAIGSAITGSLTTAWRGLAAAATTAWAGVRSAISAAWGVISPILTTIGNVIGTVLGAAFRAFQVVAHNAWQLVSVTIYNAWQIISAIFSLLAEWLGPKLSTAFRAFRTVAATVWGAVQAVIGAAWNWLLANVFTPIRDWLTATFTTAMNNFRNNTTAIWNAVSNAISTVWNFLLTRVFTPIWNWLVNTFNTAVTNFRNNTTRAWTAVQNAISAVWNFLLGRVFTPIWNWLVNTFNTAMNNFRNNTTRAWNAVRDALRAGWQFIDSRVFTPLKSGLQAVWNWFGTVVQGISNKWNELREKLAAPIRFVVNTIIRDNLVRAWNAVAERVNLKKFDFKGFDRGGWTGPGGKYKPAGVVHADEFVVQKRSRRRFERTNPGALDHINRTGQLPGYAGGGHVGIPGYAGGGLAKPWPTYVAAVVRKLFPGIGAIGGYGQRAGKSDHGSGNALDFMVPVDSALGDQISAWSMANFQALNLKYVIWKQRINSGSGWRGMEDRGSITQNHRDHPHLSFVHDTPGNKAALGSVLSAEEVAAALAAGAGGFSIPNPLHAAAMKLVDIPLNFAKGLIGGLAGRFGSSEWTDMAAGAAKLPFDWVQQFLHDKINTLIPATIFGGGAADDTAVTTGDGGKGVAQWKPTVQAALKRAGLPTTPAYTSAWLRQISSESGGNPNIAQQIRDVNGTGERAGVGLVQVIPGTFAAHRDPALPNNRRDPLANLTAGMRYARSRYGVAGMLSVIGKGRGYSEGGRVEPELFDTGGFLRPGISLVENATGKPERVLTHEQEQELMRGRQQIVINGIKHDSIPEFADALNWSLTRAETRSRYAGVR